MSFDYSAASLMMTRHVLKRGRAQSDLGSQILQAADIGQERSRLRAAVVTAFSTTTWLASVRLASDTAPITGVPTLDYLAPAVGDTVYVLQQGPVLLVVGRALGGSAVALRSTRFYQAGSGTITPSAANTPTLGTAVVFDPPFDAVPSVTISANSAVPGSQVTGVSYTGLTAAGFTPVLTRTNTSLTGFTWIAAART